MPSRFLWTVRIALPFTLAASAMLLSCGGRTQPPRIDTSKASPEQVKRLVEVIERRVYRSGQPTGEGFRILFDQGLKSVISLRQSHGDEHHIPQSHIMNFHRVPVEDHTPPSEEQMLDIIRIVTDPDSWPVLIHCSAGEGRTGTAVAAIRYSVQGWPLEKALADAAQHRDGVSLNDADLAFLKAWAGKHKPGEFPFGAK